MADHDDPAENDNTDPILEAHGEVRRRFVELWNVRTSGNGGALALDAAWQPIAHLLDGRLSADAGVAHPIIGKPDIAEAPKKTNNAQPAE